MVQDLVHQKIVANLDKINKWFAEHRFEVDLPFYSSYDIRDSGFKVSNVDANIFPAGFNNICITDRENSGDPVKFYLAKHYGPDIKNILILSEEHTNNPYYWDNVIALTKMVKLAGYNVEVAFPRLQSNEPIEMTGASGEKIAVQAAVASEGKIYVKGYCPDVVVSNNDFSEFYAEWGENLETPINPARELGWYQRKKSTYFTYYNQLATEFAQILDVDPWLFTVPTELITHYDMSDEKSREEVALKVEQLLARTREKYKQYGINQEPFAYMKNNAGTYGLAVMKVESADQIRSLNNKSRKKMKAAKGGRDVEEVILQEGIPSIVRADGAAAEPTIYLVGCQLLGGFLRSHKDKDATESLNSPGAVYKRLCVSDLKVSVSGHPMENVYGWIARLGVLAIGLEAKSMNVQYKGYTRRGVSTEDDICR